MCNMAFIYEAAFLNNGVNIHNCQILCKNIFSIFLYFCQKTLNRWTLFSSVGATSYKKIGDR